MKVVRRQIDPATFAAIRRNEQQALLTLDDGISVGDELALERTLGGIYQGPEGTHVVRVVHIDRGSPGVREGYCMASLRGFGQRAVQPVHS